jgi:hypothetical protein
MMRYFNDLGITAYDRDLYEMGIKEKEHEVYFQKLLESNRLLPWFERIFGWGTRHSYNDVDLENTSPGEGSKGYCRQRR